MSTARPASALRVVFDTNVYFSALTHPRGVPFQIWLQAVRRRFTLISSPAIIRELAEVLRDDLRWAGPDIVARLKLMVGVAEIVVPAITIGAITADDDDNRILECAVAGRADLIVSGDHHLRDLGSFRNIGIARPIDFHRTLGRDDPARRPPPTPSLALPGLVSGLNQFFPAESVSHRPFDLWNSVRRNARDFFDQVLLRNGTKIVAVDNAFLR
jgi:putative PIN family toxin of toxin-antitoxin system